MKILYIIILLKCFLFSQSVVSNRTVAAGGGGLCESPTVLEFHADVDNVFNNQTSTDTMWQSLSNASNYTYHGDSLNIYYGSGGAAGESLLVSLFTDNSGEPGTVVAGTRRAVIFSSLPASDLGQFYFPLDVADVELSGSTTYWVGVYGNADFNWSVGRDSDGGYANGNVMYVNAGGSRTSLATMDLPFYLMGCE